MNKLKTYEAPSTRVAKVELRTNLLAASIMEQSNESTVEATQHDTGKDVDFSADNNGGFAVSDWE